MIIKGFITTLIHDDLRKAWEYTVSLKWIIPEMIIDLNMPIIEVSDIKLITFWESLILYFLTTQQFTSENVTITFKYWRGSVYIIDLKLR